MRFLRRGSPVPTPPPPPSGPPPRRLRLLALRTQPISEDRSSGSVGTFRSGRSHHLSHSSLCRNNSNQSGTTGTFSLSSSCNHQPRDTRIPLRVRYDEPSEDSTGFEAYQGLNEREMNSLHKRIPGLRRHDPKTSTIRQHYYPEGGWGWVICGCAFLVHLVIAGLQLSYGVLLLHLLATWGRDSYMQAVWLGSLNLCVSLLVTPLVVGLCRRKSTRLTAVLGGLVAALACLFASFAQQLHQVFLSYGLVLGIGIGLTRETSDLMTGQYFKRRREFVEIIVQSGAGIGMTLVSTVLRYSVGRLGWRLGLQAVTGIVFCTFIIGIFYRSASLYHPQRRAILHLKNQKRKVKEKKEFKLKNPKPEEKPPYLDWSVLKARTVQVLVVSAMFSGLGLYTPVILLMAQCEEEGLDASSMGLLQTFLGLALALGCLGCGVIVVRPSTQCWISRQYLCQATLLGIGISLLALAVIEGYHGYVLFTWLYGVLLGGYRYAIKVYTFERVRARNFSRAWSLVQAAAALSSLFAAPVTGYINRSSPKAGYYFSSVMVLMSALVFFMMNIFRKKLKKMDTTLSYTTVDSQLSSAAVHEPCHLSAEHESSGGGGHQGVCTCAFPPEEVSAHSSGGFQRAPAPTLQRIGKSISFANSVDVLDDKLLERGPDGLTCISEEGFLDQLENYSYFFPGECITSCDKVENFLMQTERCMGRNHELFLQRPLRMAATVSLSEPELRGRLGEMAECHQPPPPPPPPPSSHPAPAQRGSILRNGSQRSTRGEMGTIDEMTTSV